MMIQQTEECWWYFIDLVISHNHQNYHSEPPQAITTCHQVIYQNVTNWTDLDYSDFYISRCSAIRLQYKIWLFIKLIEIILKGALERGRWGSLSWFTKDDNYNCISNVLKWTNKRNRFLLSSTLNRY